MAARLRTWTPEIVRQRIRTSMLLKRLTDHVVGKQQMSPTQVRAAEVLLKKALPDLQAIDATVKGDSAHPLVISNQDGNL